MKMFRREEGFTLVELMVVVLIIGILVAIAIPVFNSARATAEQRSCHANERTLEGALEQYKAAVMGATNPADYAGLKAILVPNYVKEAPVCPTAGDDTVYSFSTDASGVGKVSCSTHGNYSD